MIWIGGLVAVVAAAVAFTSFGPAQLLSMGGGEVPSDKVRPPLHASGGKILDAQGREVVLTGVNWFGLETGTFAPHGLWIRNWSKMLDQMAGSGFNTLRLPYSNELFKPGSKPNGIDFGKNP